MRKPAWRGSSVNHREGPWARVERTGLYTYHVSVSDGYLRRGSWRVRGKDRAERLAERKLRKLRIKLGYGAETQYLQ